MQTKNDVSIIFVVTGESIECYRNYITLCPAAAKDRRLFDAYRIGKCVNQVLGRNQLYKVPETVVNFVKLKNANSYRGHSFRISPARKLNDTKGKWRLEVINGG